MKIRHIEAIHAVMLTGSVSGAARLINLTQPAVTRTLQHAEVQLGFPLFHRSRNRLVPTQEALLLHGEITKLFTQLEAVDRLAENLRRGSVSQIRVLMVPAMGQAVLPRALSQFRRRHADVPVTVRMLNSREIVSGLTLHEADAGFIFGALQHPALHEELLGDSRVVCVAPKGMFAPGAALTMDDLNGKPLILHDQGDYLDAALSEVQRVASNRGAICVQSFHAALALAQGGIGAAVIDAYTASSANTELVDVLPLEADLRMPAQVLRLESSEMSVELKYFIDCFKSAARDVAALTASLMASAPGVVRLRA